MFPKVSIVTEFKEQNLQISTICSEVITKWENKIEHLNLNANPVFVIYQPFSLFRPGLFANHDLDDPKTAATQNSPPTDLLGEICGAGLDLLKERTKENYES